ncbi:MAG TPA: type II secretion system protein GspJ [Sedimentisphaerales bacterium]|nr:type II secretion system protein GspJ [Sedimentisphaerales bacterium]
MHCRAAQKAFTLIEMLVSLAIVASIVTMVYGSYAATARSLDVYGSRMACSERAHLALRMMARQIRCAYLPPTAAHPTQTDVGRTIKPAEPAAAFYAEPAALRSDLLSFVTTGGFDLGLDRPMGISRIAYRYEDAQDTLLIGCEPFVQRTNTLQETGVWRPILTGLTEIELKFHDGKQWQTAWDSRRAGRLPHAVRIAIGVADRQGLVHRYATTVPVACASVSRGQPTRAPSKQP